MSPFLTFHSFTLRMQVCPKKGNIYPYIPIRFGWDWNPKHPIRSGRVWILRVMFQVSVFKSSTRWFFVTFLGWLSAPFKWLSDLQLGDEKVTKNHLAYNIHSAPYGVQHGPTIPSPVLAASTTTNGGVRFNQWVGVSGSRKRWDPDYIKTSQVQQGL